MKRFSSDILLPFPNSNDLNNRAIDCLSACLVIVLLVDGASLKILYFREFEAGILYFNTNALLYPPY